MEFFETNLEGLVSKMKTKHSRIGNIMLQNDLSWMHQFQSVNRKRTLQEKQDAEVNILKMSRDKYQSKDTDRSQERKKHDSFCTLFQSESILPQFKQISSSHSGYLDDIKKGLGGFTPNNDYSLSQSSSTNGPMKLRDLKNKGNSDPYSLSSIVRNKMKNLKSNSYSFNSVSREKLQSISMAEKIDVPGANRYNPNYRALKPRSIGVIIKPITRTSHFYKPKPKEKHFLLKRISLSLKSKSKLRKRNISIDTKKIISQKDFGIRGLNNFRKPHLMKKFRIKRGLRQIKSKDRKSFFEKS
ncbi:unnamed protein product [Moneuplotes crassus]|uniref:Uncharacterized protein n=1 Tax=Euplotes crassus TaxID=5936 RepID=A0AAD1UJT0_EUPCR|nr:unnamed protein product [Moneuplotes crassus]